MTSQEGWFPGDPAWGCSTTGQMWYLQSRPTSSLTHLLVKHPLVTGICIPWGIGGWPSRDLFPLGTEEAGRRGKGANSAWRETLPSGLPVSPLPGPLPSAHLARLTAR